mmetsp:Transcript_26391/g.62927  ORF Transcript_26391/g.62927 Transcript_26391/m.62927 type:complete len:160 (-) Transcript_26391:49-528(-)
MFRGLIALLVLSRPCEASKVSALLEDEDSSYVLFLQTRLTGEPLSLSHRGELKTGNATKPMSGIQKGNSSANSSAKNQSLLAEGGMNSLNANLTSGKPVPSLSDYIKAFAALAAETTASVGDSLGSGSSDDGQDDEAVGTSAAVGATIGVVVGATVGVN